MYNSGKMSPAQQAAYSFPVQQRITLPLKGRLALPALAALNNGAGPLLKQSDKPVRPIT